MEAERAVVRLARDPRYVLLDGLHCVKHAIRFGAEVVLLVSPDPDATLALAGSLAPDVLGALEQDLVVVPAPTLAPITGNRSRGDVVGFARRPDPRPIGPGSPAAPTVLLDNPRSLGNLGAAVRAAAGLGAGAVLSTGSVDPWHPTAVRSSAGLHFAITVARVDADDLASTGGQPLIAFDPAGEDLRETDIPDSGTLVFGSERHGISAAIRQRADRLVAIPMRAQVSSYNLATSVAIALYAWSAGTAGSPRSARS